VTDRRTISLASFLLLSRKTNTALDEIRQQ
jgi:hypothetical protein